MSQEYAQHVLKVAVAQICQTIGWHSTHTSTMDLLVDVTQHFLREISRIMHRYCELYNRTEANLDDLALAYKEIGINLDELMEYIQFVDPIPLPLEVPRFPLPKESSLNFLKPGSREVLTRPVHIPEYMPPLLFESEEEGVAGGAAAGGSNEEDRLAVVPAGGLVDAKSLLNSAALAIASVAAASMGEGRALTDGGGTGGELLDDGAIVPHAVINEEVEIPMQTIEVKEQPEVTVTSPTATTTTTTTTVGDTTEEPAPAADEKPAEGSVVPKEKSTPTEEPPTGTTGGKPPIVAEEGRPTREISSVIMTTSGFISPAREGKLPESRIPIIPEERPMPAPPAPLAPLPAASHLPPVPAGSSAAASSSTLSTLAPVSSAALLASAAGTSYFPKLGEGGALAAGNGTPAGGPVGAAAAPHDPVLPPPPPPPPVKQAGEKTPKKVKKKPVDKEKKKADKGQAGASRKPDKHAGGEKGALMKPPPPPPAGELPVNPFEGPAGAAVKEEKVFPPATAGELATGQYAPARENLVFNPFVKEGAMGAVAVKSEQNEQAGGMGLPGTSAPFPPRKPPKPAKVKGAGKDKPPKKRKSAVPKLPPGPLAMEQHPAGGLFGGPIAPPPMPPNLLPAAMTAAPLPVPKPKKVSKKKAANQQRGQQHEAGSLPPPLIGPLGLGPLPLGGSHPDLAFSRVPNAPNTAALSLPLKKPPHPMGPFKQEEPTGPAPPPHSQMAAEQAAQLNLLQKMHPSLEITASPAIMSQQQQQQQETGKQHRQPSFEPKALKAPDTASDRDVIVIDDDKTPPHVASMLSPVGVAVTPSTPFTTPPTSKKQRKQAAAAGDYQLLGANMMSYPPGGPKQPSFAGHAFDGGPVDFRHVDADPHGLQFSPTGVPKTPDIKLQHSSSSSTPSWMGESPRLATPKKGAAVTSSTTTTTTGNLFSELSSKTLSECMVPSKGLGAAAEPGKKPKRPKQKPNKNAEAKRAKLEQAEGVKKLPSAGAAAATAGPTDLPGSKNPFALYPGALNPFAPDAASAYSKYLNQVASLPRIPFGMFPLPSGPGLIPDNPLFPRLPPNYPGQHRPGFQMPPNPFGLPPGLNPMNNPLLRLPGLANRLPGMGGGLTGSQRDFLDEPLDPETKLAQTPLDLQKSTCNVAPLVPPSLFQSAAEGMGLGDGTGSSELLNLSVKAGTGGPKETVTTVQSTVSSKKDTTLTISGAATSAASSVSTHSLFSSSVSTSVKDAGRTEAALVRESAYKEDQVVILPAASFLPGASPPQRSNLLVIDIDDSDGSQSTATTGGKSKDGKRKQKEHKKDRKQKDGKLKKKKDKKDKSKSKDRDREQLKELAAGTATAPGVMTMGMIGAEEALMEQLRKERKEKKEKRKEKLKKEKRKEKESRAGGGPGGGAGPSQPAGEPGLKLMLKLGGSNATQSPRSETPEQPRRDGSPELARISALVTRPPKLKGSTTPSGKGKKEDGGAGKGAPPHSSPGGGGGGGDAKLLQPAADPDDTFAALKQSAKVNFAGGAAGGTATSATVVTAAATLGSYGADESVAGGSGGRGTKMVRTAPDGLPVDTPAKAFGGAAGGGGGEPSSKKAAKESKSSKSVHHHHHHAAADTYNTTPVHMTDVDGNTVWICPACGRVDDGTPMIGCDGCDAWYHWVCVGIQVPPDDNEDWYCRVCIAKKQDTQADEKQRKRKKKDKKTSKE